MSFDLSPLVIMPFFADFPEKSAICTLNTYKTTHISFCQIGIWIVSFFLLLPSIPSFLIHSFLSFVFHSFLSVSAFLSCRVKVFFNVLPSVMQWAVEWITRKYKLCNTLDSGTLNLLFSSGFRLGSCSPAMESQILSNATKRCAMRVYNLLHKSSFFWMRS